MGIRFLCPNGHKLNVKSFLAGKRGICPRCGERFYIPTQSMPDMRVAAASKRRDSDSDSRRDHALPPVPSSGVVAAASDSAESLPSGIATGDAVWYVRTATGEQYGPANDTLIKRWVGEGRVPANSLIWRDGWADWRPASEIFPQGDTAAIGSEFDFDPDWLRPRGAGSPGNVDVEDGEVQLTPTPGRRNEQRLLRRMIIGLVVAILALVPLLFFVLLRNR